MIASLVVGLQLLSVSIVVNAVSSSEIICEATNSSCTRVEDQCIREHDGEEEQCFGEITPSISTSNCPLYEGHPIGNCANSHESNYTNSVPTSISADAYVVSPWHYGLRVSWTASNDAATDPHLQGYQVKLYSVRDGIVASTPFAGYGCICKNRNESEHSFILPYDKEDNKQLRIVVTSYPANSNYPDAYRVEYNYFDVPKSCYDSRFPYDPIHCGPPMYNEPSDIKMESTLTSNDTIVTMSTRVSWKPPTFSETTHPNHLDYPIPATYYLYLRRWRRSVRWEPGYIAKFVASNTETIAIHSLNITDETYYAIKIHAYVNCSGYSFGGNGYYGCGLAPVSDVLIPYPLPMSTTSLIISTSTASISTLNIPNSSTSLIVSSTTSSSMPISSTSTSTASISMPNTPSPSNTPNAGDGSSRWDNKASAIVICTMVGLLIAVGVIVTLVMIHRRLHIRGFWSETSSESYVSTDGLNLPVVQVVWEENDPSPMTVQKLPSPEIIIIPATDRMVYNTTHSFFLLYSHNSPEKELNVILQRLYLPLCDYIRVTKPDDYIKTDGSQALWLSNSLSEASAVLCVCNESFRDEWDGKKTASVEVSTLRERVAGALMHDRRLSKFAVVYLQQSARSYHIPELLSGLRHFLVTDIEAMVEFTTETPRYVLPS